MRVHDTEGAAVRGHGTHGELAVRERHRDALRRVDAQHHPDETLRRDHGAVLVDTRVRAGGQQQVERIGPGRGA